MLFLSRKCSLLLHPGLVATCGGSVPPSHPRRLMGVEVEGSVASDHVSSPSALLSLPSLPPQFGSFCCSCSCVAPRTAQSRLNRAVEQQERQDEPLRAGTPVVEGGSQTSRCREVSAGIVCGGVRRMARFLLPCRWNRSTSEAS